MTDKKKEREERLKKMLIENKRKMWMDLREEFFDKLGREYSAQFDNPQDLEDQSLVDLIEDTGLKVADIRREELTKMEEAIGKLEDETYGICEDCGEEIAEDRLKVIPFAVYCVRCQKKKEI